MGTLHRPPPIRQPPEDLRSPRHRWVLRRLRYSAGADAVGDVGPVAEREDFRPPPCRLLRALEQRAGPAARADGIAHYGARFNTAQAAAAPPAACQASRSRIGSFIAFAARVGSKYSRRYAIFPPTARRNTTYS